MVARVERHRQDRPAHWISVEAPIEIGAAAERLARDCEFILLDCLTIWLSNLSWEHRESAESVIQAVVSREVARLAAVPRETHLIVVSNELGCGLVPEHPVARRFRDVHGWMNQEVARLADTVYHVVAGIAIPIKRPGGGA